jgi:hypothetical protein
VWAGRRRAPASMASRVRTRDARRAGREDLRRFIAALLEV